jgi:carbon storage regulator
MKVALLTPTERTQKMLVLSRKVGQQILLPECGVTIDVVDVGKNQVRLGIVAPANVRVYRREVWDRIQHPGEPQPSAAQISQATGLMDEPNGTGLAAALEPNLARSLTYWVTTET